VDLFLDTEHKLETGDLAVVLFHQKVPVALCMLALIYDSPWKYVFFGDPDLCILLQMLISYHTFTISSNANTTLHTTFTTHQWSVFVVCTFTGIHFRSLESIRHTYPTFSENRGLSNCSRGFLLRKNCSRGSEFWHTVIVHITFS
jgi:hypothetical protein